MVDIGKRCFTKPWSVYDQTKSMKTRCYETHLPQIKSTREQNLSIKNILSRPVRRHVSQILPSITRHTPTNSNLLHGHPLQTNVEPTSTSTTTTIPCNSSVYETAQRFIIRNNMSRLSPDMFTAHVTHNINHPRKNSLYDHIPAKIDTGLPRIDTKPSSESPTYQLEPSRPMNWSALKHDIEQDVHIRAQSNRLQFNTGVTYSTQLTSLGNLIRTKIKTHLASINGSGDERYKIVVHLTVFPTTSTGLHVASRCLWNRKTDNSITIKMQGIDCDILIIAFLCYTDIGA